MATAGGFQAGLLRDSQGDKAAAAAAGVPTCGLPMSHASPPTLAQRLLAAATLRDSAWGPPGWRDVGRYQPYRFMKTLFVWEPRAVRTYAVPWLVVVGFSVLVTLVYKLALSSAERAALNDSTAPYSAGYSLVLTVVGFLLVFRLNRAAIRFWDSRTAWGKLVEAGRLLAEQACVHCAHDMALRDDIIRWCDPTSQPAPEALPKPTEAYLANLPCSAFAKGTLAFVVGCKQLLHGTAMDANELSGVLSAGEVRMMEAAKHMPLFASSAIRTSLLVALGPGEPIEAAIYRSSVRDAMERQVDLLVSLIGMMERIKSTPLPLVYVSHLRTSLLLYLLLMPVLFVASWGWGTPAALAAIGFFMLGVEGASTECESPFRKDHWNHLRMSSACALLFDNTQQILDAAEWHEQRGAALRAAAA